MTHRFEKPLLVLGILVAVAAWAVPAFDLWNAPWSLILYGGESLLAALATWLDKRAAVRDRRRFSEFGLHLFELLGGFPGALLAQRFFRHKTVKRSYRAILWLIVLLHVAAWVWYLSVP